MNISHCPVRDRSASLVCSSHITQYWSLTWCILSRSSPRLLLSSSSAPPSSSTSPNIPLVLQTQTPSRPTEGNFIHLSRCNFTKIIAAVASAAVFTSVASARMTAPEIVSNINIITGMSQSLQAPASSINTLSGPLFLIGQGPFPVGRPLVSSALFTLLNLA